MRRTPQPAPISGTTTGIEPGRTVTLVVSDGDRRRRTAVINFDGSFSTTANLRLDRRPLTTVTASVADAAGNTDGERLSRTGYERGHRETWPT